MSTHSFAALSLPQLGQPGSLALPGARRWAATGAGWIAVQAGRAWLTRDGDPDDHVLATGERLWLKRGDVVTAESWRPGEPAWLVWRPEPVQPLALVFAGALTRAVARGARGLAARLLALARSAEASACRAQGSICAGDSIASAGALQ
jgi:hypothetical protein